MKPTQIRTPAEVLAPQTKPQIPRSNRKSTPGMESSIISSIKELLTPDLQLTISPTLLNTIISSATNPIFHTSSDFSAPIDTSVAPAIDSRNFQTTPVINSSLAHFHEPLPPPVQYPLPSSTFPHFSSPTHNPITPTNISSSEIPRNSNTSILGNSRNTHHPRDYPTFSSSRNVNTHTFNAHPNSPPTTAGVEIFHSHATPTPNPRSPQPIPQAATSSLTTFHHTPINHRPSQQMTPAQISRLFRNVTSPPHQAHLDITQSSRLINITPTRLKQLIPHRSPLIHMPDTSDSTRDFDLQCLATDFYLTVYTELSGQPTAPLTPGTPATPLRSNGLLEH